MEEYDCDYYAHGDDPVYDHTGTDCTAIFKERGIFKVFKRTEGVSTTEITGRLLNLVDALNNKNNETGKIQKFEDPPK